MEFLVNLLFVQCNLQMYLARAIIWKRNAKTFPKNDFIEFGIAFAIIHLPSDRKHAVR